MPRFHRLLNHLSPTFLLLASTYRFLFHYIILKQYDFMHLVL